MQALLTKSINDYRAGLRAASVGLWRGNIDIFQFFEGMASTIRVRYREAWFIGAREAGIQPAELTEVERQRLTDEIRLELMRVNKLARFINENSRAAGGKRGTVYERLELWVQGYTRIREVAKTMAGRDKKQIWTLNPAEHCSSCLKLQGKVKRSSFWAAEDVHPKAWAKLVCKVGCKCGLEFTDLPVTPGPLPALP